MSDREALAAALEDWTIDTPPPWKVKAITVQAARERLTQLPERCGYCGGSGGFVDDSGPGWVIGERVCSTCYGSGKEYPSELVERIAGVLRQVTLGNINASFKETRYPLIAVAVLNALNEEPA